MVRYRARFLVVQLQEADTGSVSAGKGSESAERQRKRQRDALDEVARGKRQRLEPAAATAGPGKLWALLGAGPGRDQEQARARALAVAWDGGKVHSAISDKTTALHGDDAAVPLLLQMQVKTVDRGLGLFAVRVARAAAPIMRTVVEDVTRVGTRPVVVTLVHVAGSQTQLQKAVEGLRVCARAA